MEHYFTEHQLARQVGVTVRTLRNWRAIGETPRYLHIGKRIYFARTDCEERLRSRRVEAA
jgi:hypothetical protein